MRKFSYVIRDEQGIHARPASLLVKVARSFDSDIQLESKGECVNLKNLLAVMCLGIMQGDVINITCHGHDEEKAEREIKIFLEENL
ncbi:MAG: HPr family phosphocarrier protein [Bacillota bacterium]|nr:HPr family phosphocarrier protein [Bacillota bacterium]HHU61494.1 HPr family phosphocarrier protein [Natronincola sp.]